MTTRLIVEDPNSDGDMWIECRDCGRCNYLSKGPIGHSRGCASGQQYSVVASAPVVTDVAIRTFAANVRKYSMSRGRDEDVLTAVRRGYLSVSDAMNTDD